MMNLLRVGCMRVGPENLTSILDLFLKYRTVLEEEWNTVTSRYYKVVKTMSREMESRMAERRTHGLERKCRKVVRLRSSVLLYLELTIVIDLYSRKVIGWSMKQTLTKDLVVDSLLMAVWRFKPKVFVYPFRPRIIIWKR